MVVGTTSQARHLRPPLRPNGVARGAASSGDFPSVHDTQENSSNSLSIRPTKMMVFLCTFRRWHLGRAWEGIGSGGARSNILIRLPETLLFVGRIRARCRPVCEEDEGVLIFVGYGCSTRRSFAVKVEQ